MWKACTKKQEELLSAEAEIPLLTSLLFCTNIIGLSSKILLGGLNFLFKTPAKIEMYHNAQQSHNWQTMFKLGIVTSYRDLFFFKK